MDDAYILAKMLKTLINERNKLAYAVIKCHEEGYEIDNSKANLFYLFNIVSDCYKIVPRLNTIQRNKLLNITRKLLNS